MRNAAGVPQGKLKWQRAPLGAGGWLRSGVSISNAGDLVTGGDTSGIWVRPSTSSAFNDLLNTNTLPAGSFGPSATDNTTDSAKYGCAINAIAPSNGNIGIFVFNLNLYKSTNLLSASPTLTKLGGPYTAGIFNANMDGCLVWRKAVFDPSNPNFFLIGSQGPVLYYSTDGSTISTIAVDTPTAYGNSAAYHQVAVDPSSTVTGGQHMIWYYATKGVGVKRSTTGVAGPYTLVTGSPTNVRSLKVDANGNVFALNAGEGTGNQGNLYKATSSGSFAKITSVPPYEFCDVAINPQNTLQIALVNDDWALAMSVDGGTTWLGADVYLPANNTMSATSLSWLQARDTHGTSGHAVNTTFQVAGGNIEFHPTNGTCYVATGAGIFKSTPPTATGTKWHWQEDTLGVEQLVITDVFTPSGGKPIYSAGDFALYEVNTDTYAGTTSAIPQPIGGSGDETSWAIESAPGNANFLVACCGYHHNAHAYRTSPSDYWHVFSGSFPRAGLIYGGGVILPQTTTDLYGFFCANVRPVSSHDQGATWAYEDVNMPGMNTKAKAYYGAGTSQLIFTSVASWDGNQDYTVTINAASGAGSVSVSGKTITVTPATTGTTASAIAAQINANGSASALVSTTSGGSGTVSAGSVTLSFTSGWGWYPIFYVSGSRTACLDKTNGDIYAYNYGDDGLGIAAPWAGIWKRDHTAGTWARVAGAPLTVTSQINMRMIPGQTGHGLLSGQNGSALYRTTNGWATSSQVGNGTYNFTSVACADAGKAAPGQTYPAIYVYGALNGVFGFYACFDGGWTNWNYLGSQYPGNLVYGVSWFAAHPDIFGRVDVGTSGGAGGWIGTYDCPITLS